ncbi:Protein SCO1-like protein 1 [Hibiscus syriacus]|uniref:Protein SCO1-like protein 1 n=1 Tax=Hibiscus syriacus TaxID=106335 RepID=A0A6A3CY46_HIBSY|nr:Protein SCO1-like protein 1 [Hibiscus syriacus]
MVRCQHHQKWLLIRMARSLQTKAFEDFMAQDSALAFWLLSTITSATLPYRVKEVCDTLESCGSPVTPVEQIVSILKGLPREYQSFMAVITTMREKSTLDVVSSMLIDAETQLAGFEFSVDSLLMSAKWHRLGRGRGHLAYSVNYVVRWSLVQQYWGSSNIFIGNGASIPVESVGNTLISSQSQALLLTNILHVPKITKNLLSVSKLARDNNVFLEFYANDCLFRDEVTGNVLLRVKQNGGLYSFELASDKSQFEGQASANIVATSEAYDLWHRRLGHPSFKTLKSVCNQLYYIAFLDACTRHSWLYLLKDKSQLIIVFQMFKNMVATQFNMPIKAIPNDWGEQCCGAKTSTLIELALVLLAQSTLSLKFWSYVVVTAVLSPLACFSNAKTHVLLPGVCLPRPQHLHMHIPRDHACLHAPPWVHHLYSFSKLPYALSRMCYLPRISALHHPKHLPTPTGFVSNEVASHESQTVVFKHKTFISSYDEVIPTTVHEAFQSEKWTAAIHDELNALDIRRAWLIRGTPRYQGKTFRKPSALFNRRFEVCDPDGKSLVCKLHKALYGLRQAPRNWNNKLRSSLIALGFRESKADNSLFVNNQAGSRTFILVYSKEVCARAIGKSTADLSQPTTSPMIVANKLSKDDGNPLVDAYEFRSIVSSYYTYATRPDVALSVSKVAQYMQAPRESKQKSSRSTMEAEYKSIVDAAAEVTWMNVVLADLGEVSGTTLTVWCDNSGAIAMSANPVYHAQSKHVDLDVHFVREKVATKQLCAVHQGWLVVNKQLRNCFRCCRVVITTVKWLQQLMLSACKLCELKISNASKAVKEGPTAGKAAIGGPFSLINDEGKRVTEKDFMGKWSLIYFGFTHCPDICPDELQKLTAAIDKIKEKAGIEILPVFISVDPKRDTVEQVHEYVNEFHPKLVGLTGSTDEIKKVARAYRVYYMKTAEHDVDWHSLATCRMIGNWYLMDPNMEFVKFLGKNNDVDSLTNGVIKEKNKKHRGTF